MKASAVRKIAHKYSLEQLSEAIHHLSEHEEEILSDIEGQDMGERLTHLLLAHRLRGKIDAGDDPKEAFRDVMGAVRDTLANE